MAPVSTANERVVDFLYLIMRDHLATGIVEEEVQKLEAARDELKLAPGKASVFTNKGLELYARELEERLRELNEP